MVCVPAVMKRRVVSIRHTGLLPPGATGLALPAPRLRTLLGDPLLAIDR